jgi:hypothetical protein
MNRLIKILCKIEQKRTGLVQNFAGSKRKQCGLVQLHIRSKQREQVSPKLREIEAKRTIALNFIGSNREKNRRYLRPSMSDTAADGVIGTAMKSCIHRHPTHLEQRTLRPPKLLQTKTALFSFGGLRSF